MPVACMRLESIPVQIAAVVETVAAPLPLFLLSLAVKQGLLRV
jgi:hypothetical protein